MQETDLHYPAETCPFCSIAAAFPFPEQGGLWRSKREELEECVPGEEEAETDGGKTSPRAFVVLRSMDVVAFLDILPMTGGKLKFLSSVRNEGEDGDWDWCLELRIRLISK